MAFESQNTAATRPFRVLMLGEVYSKAGRQAVAGQLKILRHEHRLDLIIANGESMAGGYGLTGALAEELFNDGVDVITSGNRIFDRREMVEWLQNNPELPVLRPLNYPPGTVGKAWHIIETGRGPLEVLNVNGRVYFQEMDSPFRLLDQWLPARQAERPKVPLIIDFHAEATSEKVVFGWYMDGRASAVLGTHTRTPTADARLLNKGTAYVSDVGMVGPYNSLGGLEVENALKPFTAHYTSRSRPGKKPGGPVQFNSVLVDIEAESGQALAITRLDFILEDETM